MQRKVIQTKSVKCMPFYLSLTSFLNGCIWTAYAGLGSIDPWMLVCIQSFTPINRKMSNYIQFVSLMKHI